MIRGEDGGDLEDGGNISFSDEEVDQEVVTQMKKRVEVMQKENEELKAVLVLREENNVI